MAIIVVVISLLSTFTLSKSGSDPSRLAASGGSPNAGGGDFSAGAGGSTDTGGSGGGAGGLGDGSVAGIAGPGDVSGGGTVVDANGNVVSTGGGTNGGGGASGGAHGTTSGGKSGGGGTSGTNGTSGGGGGSGGNTVVGGKSYDCSKKQNAGASDIGVTANSINFAATVVKTGIAKDFLSDAQFGMEAVRQKINSSGGVCGRLINIKYDDDGWDPSAGNVLIQKYIGSKQYFGLAVNPSSEGLRYPIDNGLLDQNQFPVIGADGMLIDQYKDPWVWPVATSTHSVMHIMFQDAAKRGAKTFGIVYDNRYRFGVEGHDAFKGAVTRAGLKLNGDQAVQGGQTSYKNEVDSFSKGCGQDFSSCDFVALLLEPATAEQWVRDGGLGDGKKRPAVGFGAPQPLFVRSFAVDCSSYCDHLRVWTSFKPPIPPFTSEQAVATYNSEVKGQNQNADTSNPHVEGAYVGMKLLEAALRQLGPAPTRAGMRQVLDSMTLDTGLGPALTFKSGTSGHFAAISAQAFDAIYNVGSFNQWQYTNSGFVADSNVSADL